MAASRAPIRRRWCCPPIMDPLYGYETVNVEAQTRDPHSLLQLDAPHAGRPAQHRRLRPRQPALPLSEEPQGPGLSARATRARRILCVANVSRTPQAVELDLSEFAGRVPVELTGGSLFPPIGAAHLPADPAALRLLLVHARRRETDAPSWHTPAPEPLPDYVTLVLRNRLDQALWTAAARGARARDAAALPAEAPLVRRQGPDAARRRASPIWHRSAASATCCWPRSRSRRDGGDHSAGCCRLSIVLGGRAGAGAAARSLRWRACGAGGASAC